MYVSHRIVELCMARTDGKYLLVKDPNRQNLRLYDIPGGSFEHSRIFVALLSALNSPEMLTISYFSNGIHNLKSTISETVVLRTKLNEPRKSSQ